VSEKPAGPALVVVGSGIQWGAQTTAAAERAIRGADRVLFAVADPWAARWLSSLNTTSESFQYPRDGTPRADIYATMVARVLELLSQGNNVCAVFYGSPAWLTQPAHLAVRGARERGYRARMLPGISAVECLLAELGIDPGEHGLHVYEATNFLVRSFPHNPHAHLVLCQVGIVGQRRSAPALPRAGVLRGLKLLRRQLSCHYPRDHKVVLYEAPQSPLQESRVEEHSIEMLCDVSTSALSTLYVPPLPTADN
jgi:precorrin-6B methylase 1